MTKRVSYRRPRDHTAEGFPHQTGGILFLPPHVCDSTNLPRRWTPGFLLGKRRTHGRALIANNRRPLASSGRSENLRARVTLFFFSDVNASCKDHQSSHQPSQTAQRAPPHQTTCRLALAANSLPSHSTISQSDARQHTTHHLTSTQQTYVQAATRAHARSIKQQLAQPSHTPPNPPRRGYSSSF